jgi:hypothetical protein
MTGGRFQKLKDGSTPRDTLPRALRGISFASNEQLRDQFAILARQYELLASTIEQGSYFDQPMKGSR